MGLPSAPGIPSQSLSLQTLVSDKVQKFLLERTQSQLDSAPPEDQRAVRG